MADFEERRVGDLTVRIDRLICVGFGDCLDEIHPWFELDDEGIATFHSAPPLQKVDALLEACRACPVDAITVHDGEGRCLAP